MNSKCTLLTVALLTTWPSAKAQETRLSITRSPAQVEVTWSAQAGANNFPLFELQESQDLRKWTPRGERLQGSPEAPTVQHSVPAAEASQHSFFRVLSIAPQSAGLVASEGADIFGYSEWLTREFGRVGAMTSEQFEAAYPAPDNYLPRISFDPTTAVAWDQFSAPSQLVVNPETGVERWTLDFSLNQAELPLFMKNGFVVTERLGRTSFADVFYDLWHTDLPVFVSTDAILQAWHRTYDAILEETEETFLYNGAENILNAMAAQIPALALEARDTPLAESLADADYFLGVARSLLRGADIGAAETYLGQEARVAQTLGDIQNEAFVSIDFLGSCRRVDFSQFKVRGHYTHTPRLGRYFKTMMWLGRMDIPVAGGPWSRCGGEIQAATPRELGAAIALWRLLQMSGHFETWSNMQRILEMMVGPTDSMTFAQLSGVLAGAGIQTLSDARDAATLERIQSDILAGRLGVQNIRSDWFDQPLGAEGSYALPNSFTVFGQKFTVDNWAFMQTTMPSLRAPVSGEVIPRRVPGALDIAFATLGNNHVVPDLLAQITGSFSDPGRPHARAFRDGFPIQHGLAAVRAVIDQHPADAWEQNIYMMWLGTLRELSAPTTDAKYPEVMRTREWAMKNVNTQLASWTHLRHDTILYTKQAVGCSCGCLYPFGFVEPRVEFWSKFQRMANLAADRLSALQINGGYTFTTNMPYSFNEETGEFTGGETPVTVTLQQVRDRQITHLRLFADTVAKLEELSTKQLASIPFTPEENIFLDSLIEDRMGGGLYGGPLRYDGWYPDLFYKTMYWTADEFQLSYGSAADDRIVADVYTNPANGEHGDPGSVLHQGIGRVNLMMVAIDNGGDKFICAGPVLSHYEFETIGAPLMRVSDEEWRGILSGWTPPDRIEGLAPPPWTAGYLVPAQ